MFSKIKIGWLAWFVISLFYAYQYILRVMPSVMLNDIIKQFHIDTAIFGQFSGAYYIGYCLLHIPVGIMLDKYGPKKVVTICIILTVIGLLPIIWNTHWLYLIIGRFAIGVGSSAAILGAFSIIRIEFGKKNFTKMLSITVTIGLIGGIYGGVPVSYLCETYHYQTVVKMFVIFGTCFAAISYWLLPNNKSATNDNSTALKNIGQVLTNKKVILSCFFAGLMVGPLEGFADAWGAKFLVETYSYDNNTASYLVSLIYIGMCFSPILSVIAEKTRSYSLTIAGAGIIMLIIFTLLVLNMLGTSTMSAIFFIVGICCTYQILAVYHASTYSPDHLAGLTTAVANMIIMSFGYLFHSTIGLIIKIYINEYNNLAFSYGVSIVPIALLIGVIGFLIIGYIDNKLRNNKEKL